jgi:hypothetical protein
MGFLLLGGPDETRETVLHSLEFVDALNLDMVKLTVGIRIYPYTKLSRTAMEEGIIAPDDDLLLPKFYLQRDIADWLRQTVQEWMNTRPNWVM